MNIIWCTGDVRKEARREDARHRRGQWVAGRAQGYSRVAGVGRAEAAEAARRTAAEAMTKTRRVEATSKAGKTRAERVEVGRASTVTAEMAVG